LIYIILLNYKDFIIFESILPLMQAGIAELADGSPWTAIAKLSVYDKETTHNNAFSIPNP
jgi:hypothetical protein